MPIFGTDMPILVVNGRQTQMPNTIQGGRYEDFIKESDIYTDVNGDLQEDIYGWRLRAEYEWHKVTNDFLEELADAAGRTSGVGILLGPFPVVMKTRVVEFKKGLRDGLNYEDAASIRLKGVRLFQQYPNPDLLTTAMTSLPPAMAVVS